MPLLVEDGTNVANANSYVSRTEIIDYAAARGVTIADDASTDVAAIKAMDWLDERPWKGRIANDDQALKWPRLDLWQNFKPLPSDIVPKDIRNAQCEAIMIIHSGIDLWPNREAGQDIKSEKIGPLETEYFAPPLIEAIAPRLRALLRPYVGIGALQVSRA